jgi:hypothetical protein
MTKIEDERAAGERLQDGIDCPIQGRTTCKQSFVARRNADD